MQVNFNVDENLLVQNFAAWSSRFLAAELGKPAIVKVSCKPFHPIKN